MLLVSSENYSVVKRKFHTFHNDPIGSIKAKAKDEVKWLLQSWGEYQLRQRGVADVLLAFLARRPSSALPPNFSDLWFLYSTVTQRKPRIILEFGSGCSTVVLAQALWDNQHNASQSEAYLYSVDADAYWATTTARAMPVHLRDMCKISSSPLLEVEYAGVRGFRHANVPDIAANLVYLDGPALTPDRAVAIDVLDMEDKFPDDFYLIIDGRKKNTVFLQQYMKRKYRFKARKMFHNQLFELMD